MPIRWTQYIHLGKNHLLLYHSGKRDKYRCGTREKTNRESPQINANRIFLAPSCSAPAYRLRRIARRLEKCCRKNRRAGFSLNLLLFLCNRKNNETTEKPARGFFSQHFSREGAILRRRSAGAEHPNARKMRFALIRGDSRFFSSSIHT